MTDQQTVRTNDSEGQKAETERAERLGRDSIVEFLALAKEREEPVVLSPQGLNTSFFCLVTDVSHLYLTLRNPIPPEKVPLLNTVESYALFCRSYLLVAKKLEPFGTLVRFPVPDFAALNQARQMERVHFSAKENVVVEIQHPFDPATVLRRRVFDMSKGGLSFRSRTKNPFIQPGRILPSCQIFLQGLPYERKRGRIVYVKQIIDLNSCDYYQVGVQFIEEDEDLSHANDS
jgi:hypothetical protein